MTRAQMAAFLSRAYRLPDGPEAGFDDVASDAWYAAVAALGLVASGVTAGCGDGSGFCPDQPTTRGQMAAFLHRAENRGGWEQITGESADGRYVEFRASEDQTEVPWRPMGLALTVRCTYSDTEDPELEVSAFGYGKRTWFFGQYGVIEYRFGGDTNPRRIFTDVSEDNNALIIGDDDLAEDFLDAMGDDTSNELSPSLFDEGHSGAFDFRIAGELSITGYSQHVKPLVDACD